jgi:hypothetical protein
MRGTDHGAFHPLREGLVVQRPVAAFRGRMAVFLGRHPVQVLPTVLAQAILPPVPAVKVPVTA